MVPNSKIERTSPPPDLHGICSCRTVESIVDNSSGWSAQVSTVMVASRLHRRVLSPVSHFEYISRRAFPCVPPPKKSAPSRTGIRAPI